jgi:hypothetical protein
MIARNRNRDLLPTLSARSERRNFMPISNTPAIERIARVIAGRMASINAEGEDRSAGDEVDRIWRDHVDDALAILRTLREPDEVMAAAGDSEIWERMVLAALAAERASA